MGRAFLTGAAEAGEDFFSRHLPLFFAWFACGVVVFLVAFVVYMTFNTGLPTTPNLSFRNYADAFDSYLVRQVIPNTAIVGLGTVAVVLFFSVPLAWLLHRTNVPLRELWTTLIAVAVIVPGVLKAMGWLMLLSPKIGLINHFFVYVFGLEEAPLSVTNVWGVAFVQGLVLTPTMFFLLAGPVRSLDPALEEAAQVSGATMWQTIWRVSLRVLWPAILGGGIYTFMTSIAMFEIAALLGDISRVPVLATELFLKIKPYGSEAAIPRYGMAGVYAMLITIPSLFLLLYYRRVIEKGYRYAVVSGRGYRPRDMDLGTGRFLALFFVFFYLLLAVILPMLVLLWSSLLPYFAMPSRHVFSLLSLRWYARIFDLIGGPKVIINTIALVVCTPVIVLFFSFMISWIVVKTRLRGRGWMDAIAMAPHAIPSIGFGFALVVFGILGRKWLPWLPLYQTIGAIIIANAVNRLSYATRITNAALLQVGRELEESAQVCGAKRLGTMWWIVAPLIKPSLVFGGLWTGLLAFREISMALMLAGPNNQVLAVRIWTKWQTGPTGMSEASALGVSIVILMGLVVFVAQKAVGVRFLQGQQGTNVA